MDFGSETPNSDLKIAVDFWVDFCLLLFFQGKIHGKITKKSPAKFTRDFVQKNSPRISAEALKWTFVLSIPKQASTWHLVCERETHYCCLWPGSPFVSYHEMLLLCYMAEGRILHCSCHWVLWEPFRSFLQVRIAKLCHLLHCWKGCSPSPPSCGSDQASRNSSIWIWSSCRKS